MFYTVNDVAKRTKLSVHTIRYYAKEGLVNQRYKSFFRLPRGGYAMDSMSFRHM
ncbi:MerR family DNA-binding transcriptional regulator [Desulfosporosinus sp. Sb-LF]|uniref:MerR family DNA-binding transcriptional regulator n=1 Tax=Desulfosporosinus sp. Sb-LF TaxID=2560027 RepID=UPI00107F1B01|nr:MerR family DNA-binding transcriptional regulator [Desulfosporosinus sp. Sb-LF]TGE31072.1 MerR family DNA-binding transcriptional regulator [Desulfosporosinus sp. Sb-LF]